MGNRRDGNYLTFEQMSHPSHNIIGSKWELKKTNMELSPLIQVGQTFVN